MNRIIYFNINYVCNNHCLFCFSSSTGTKFDYGVVSCQDCLRRLNSIGVTADDLIVINGGEPTLHSEFYELMDSLTNYYNAKIVVYTNGVSLNAEYLPSGSRITFVIPVHGPASIHNKITRNPESFQATMAHLRELERFNFRYALKFIINEQMIQNTFNIKTFLIENELSPCEIVLARMNETKISRENHYAVPHSSYFRSYMNCQLQNLCSYVPLKLLDVPPCLVDGISIHKDICINQKSPQFYFNDPNHIMEQRNYYKQVQIGDHCASCAFRNICTLMSRSYLTLAYHAGWSIEPE